MSKARVWSVAALAFTLASCSVQVANNSSIKDEDTAAGRGQVQISATRGGERSQNNKNLTPEEVEYAWRYPQFPQEWNINLDNRDPNNSDYLSNRERVYDQSTEAEARQTVTALGPLGSYAGPWIEGEETKLLPVSNPNIVLGQAILKVIGNEITPEMRPTLEESPFQLFLKLRKLGTDAGGKLRTITVTMPAANTSKPGSPLEPADFQVQLDKESLWSVTMTLYRELSPDWKTTVPTRANSAVKADGAAIYGNCNMCHGADGWGLGLSGLKLQPPPANFREPRRLYNRTEAHLREVLHNGIYGSAMPPWKDKLSDDEINLVVSYIRHFSYSTENPVMSSPPTFRNQ
jgi:mono/diheme cytochrome c family protein